MTAPSYSNNRTDLTDRLTVRPVLLSTVCSQHPVETGEWGRNADTDVYYAPHMVLPLQPQHASQQSEATYDPYQITPAAEGRRCNMWTLYAFCWL